MSSAPNSPALHPLVFIDLETTGANPVIDRITEIGLIEVVDGEVRRWETLVNPERTIPAFIQRLTGIDNDMVARAPTFAAVAEELRRRLHGKLFVAHNARFDYGFVKNEFKRLGQRFQADVLCTVKLSRKLFPQHHKHNLDSLISRHGLVADGRHRALADAEMIWQFWDRVARHETGLDTAIAAQLQRPSLPPHLDAGQFEDLPDTPGVYLLYGEADICLYVGKSINLRQRVFSHFAADTRAHKEMQLSQQVRRLDWRETVGEFGALLLESRLVKELNPLHNRQLRAHPETCAWRLEEVEPGDFRPNLVYAAETDFAAGGLYGPFASKREASNALRKIAEAYKLCPTLLGLEKPNKAERACFTFQVQKCKGACIGREPRGQHSARLMSALARLKMPPWPWPGAVGLVERDDFRDMEEIHVLSHWRYLGTARDEAGVYELLDNAVAFDLDTYKLLKTQIGKGKLEVRRL